MAAFQRGVAAISLITRFAAFRWTAALIVLLTLMANGMALMSMQAKLDVLAGTKRFGALWIAQQLEFELLRFDRTLAEFAHPSTDVSVEDVQFRFDILWSRISLAIDGQEGVPAAFGTAQSSVVPELWNEIRRQEDAVQSLDPDAAAEARRLLGVFSAYETRLHDYTIAAKDEQASQDASARDDLLFISTLMAFLGVAIALASAFLAALFFVDSRHHRKISDENLRLLDLSRKAYAAKSEFLSTISHELRTPLTSIKGAIGLLRGGSIQLNAEKGTAILDIAYQNSNRLGAMINDILDAEKIESAKLSYTFDEVDIENLVAKTIELYGNFSNDRNVRVEVLPPQSHIHIRGDHERLSQALSNILSNAVKFSKPDGVVTVSVADLGNDVQISVQDEGIGIPDSFRDRVFEKFTQVDSSDTRRYGGTGLGMFIAKTIVEDHGGNIDYESSGGAGTIFYVKLPVFHQFHS